MQAGRSGHDAGSSARVSGEKTHSNELLVLIRTRWENRSTEWVRFISVGLGAEPTTVEIEGNEGAIRTLPDCFDV